MGEEKKPFRPRHDGWTPGRQTLFLAKLTETGRVTDACRAVGLSTTTAYRTYRRSPDFADRWDMALASRRSVLEQVAFERAVHGVEVTRHRDGKVVGMHKQYSDALLRFMLERDDKREKLKRSEKREPPIEEVRDEILRRIRLFERTDLTDNEKQAEVDRMNEENERRS